MKDNKAMTVLRVLLVLKIVPQMVGLMSLGDIGIPNGESHQVDLFDII